MRYITHCQKSKRNVTHDYQHTLVLVEASIQETIAMWVRNTQIHFYSTKVLSKITNNKLNNFKNIMWHATPNYDTRAAIFIDISFNQLHLRGRNVTNDIFETHFLCILALWRKKTYDINFPNLNGLNMINVYLQFVHTVRANNCTGIVKMISTSYHLSKELPKNLKGRSKSSQEWLMRQLADPYVEKARRLNYRYCYL